MKKIVFALITFTVFILFFTQCRGSDDNTALNIDISTMSLEEYNALSADKKESVNIELISVSDDEVVENADQIIQNLVDGYDWIEGYNLSTDKDELTLTKNKRPLSNIDLTIQLICNYDVSEDIETSNFNTEFAKKVWTNNLITRSRLKNINFEYVFNDKEVKSSTHGPVIANTPFLIDVSGDEKYFIDAINEVIVDIDDLGLDKMGILEEDNELYIEIIYKGSFKGSEDVTDEMFEKIKNAFLENDIISSYEGNIEKTTISFYIWDTAESKTYTF